MENQYYDDIQSEFECVGSQIFTTEKYLKRCNKRLLAYLRSVKSYPDELEDESKMTLQEMYIDSDSYDSEPENTNFYDVRES